MKLLAWKTQLNVMSPTHKKSHVTSLARDAEELAPLEA